VRKRSTTDSASGMPLDHLIEASSRLVTLLVKASWLDGLTKDETSNGDNANDCDASKQPNCGSFWCVSEWAKSSERSTRKYPWARPISKPRCHGFKPSL